MTVNSDGGRGSKDASRIPNPIIDTRTVISSPTTSPLATSPIDYRINNPPSPFSNSLLPYTTLPGVSLGGVPSQYSADTRSDQYRQVIDQAQRDWTALRAHGATIDERFFDAYETRPRRRRIDMVVLHVSDSPPDNHRKDPSLPPDAYHVGWILEQSNSHYAISRDGRIYPVISPDYFCRHAGKNPLPRKERVKLAVRGEAPLVPPLSSWSLWDGQFDVDQNAIGIEIIGKFTHRPPEPNAKQVQATKVLVQYLMEKYSIPSDRVLGHNQIACEPLRVDASTGMPSFVVRGRKMDPGPQFPWERIGLADNYRILDPDILAGRAGLQHKWLDRATTGQLSAYQRTDPSTRTVEISKPKIVKKTAKKPVKPKRGRG
ncbi:TPA: N-acetylmuramoyl-L-alanine amidase [Candidatus Woesearchaeota archaeon]|nr:N-acetylmuramoyl-L-alanine amidase [Candidatus Woesearchaeota archaeon]